MILEELKQGGMVKNIALVLLLGIIIWLTLNPLVKIKEVEIYKKEIELLYKTDTVYQDVIKKGKDRIVYIEKTRDSLKSVVKPSDFLSKRYDTIVDIEPKSVELKITHELIDFDACESKVVELEKVAEIQEKRVILRDSIIVYKDNAIDNFQDALNQREKELIKERRKKYLGVGLGFIGGLLISKGL